MADKDRFLQSGTKLAMALAFTSLAPAYAGAMPLNLPALAKNGSEHVDNIGSYNLPVGPWAAGQIDSVATEGRVTQSVWMLPADSLTTLQILMPLRDQLSAQGYDIQFECNDEACGGFDFRFSTEIAPEPEMHVDLGDFRFISALRSSGDETEAVSVLVSKSVTNGYIQVMHVEPANIENVELTVSTNSPDIELLSSSSGNEFGQMLEQTGFAVLEDLTFTTGSSALQEQEFQTLSNLALYLNTNPGRKVALVGHTDTEGSLEGNINLSKRRAESVMQTLISEHGVEVAQLKAEGMGYLSPRATNLTDEGRALNRRVEVILTSTN